MKPKESKNAELFFEHAGEVLGVFEAQGVGNGGDAGQIEVFAAMEYLLDTADTTYRNILAGLSKGQRTVLSTIAIDGHAENVLSQSYISRHYLGAASSVQAAVRSLLAKQLISRDADTYFLDDKFL